MNLLIGLLIYLHCASATEDAESLFLNSQSVPDAVPAAPKQLLEVYNGGKRVIPGGEYKAYELRYHPNITWPADPDKFYTFIICSPDAPSRVRPTHRNFLVTLIVNIPGDNVQKGKMLAVYAALSPAKNTGYGRAVLVLYEQPGKLDFSDEPYSGDRQFGNRVAWSPKEFIDKHQLGAPIRGLVCYVEYDFYSEILLREFVAGRRQESIFFD